MKKLIKNTLVLVILFTTLLGHANSSFKNSNDEKRTTLTLTDVKQGDELLIKDTHGIILYKEKIQNSGHYIKGFDLTELPDGDYFFELIKEMKIKIIPFNVTINEVTFKKDIESVIYKPLVKTEENKVYISKLSLHRKPLEIKVYYHKNDTQDFNLIYTETIENTKSIGRILNLDEKEKGHYKIIIKTEGRTFIDYAQF